MRIWKNCRSFSSMAHGVTGRLTFFHAVLLGPLVIWVLVLMVDSLDAVIKMVLEGSALGGAGAFYVIETRNCQSKSP